MSNLIITFFASFLVWGMFVGLGFLWLIDGRVKKEIALHAFFASLISWGVAEMIKELIPTTRPYVVRALEPLTLTNPADNAFPSTHTAIAFGLAVSLWLHNKRSGVLFLMAALLIGIARVVGHVHYPLDILGGAVIGSVVGVAVDKLHLYRLIKKLTS